MPRDLATSDSSDAVDTSYLLATFEGGNNPTNLDPVMQSILDVVGTVLAGLGEFAYDDSTNALTFTLTNNSVTAAQARATADAHVREWRSRLGIGDDWSEIPSGTAIGLGKVVEHGGAYFGCITAHNRGGTGPDGDAANWILLSNYRGNWVDAWYPAGAFVRHAGLSYVATVAVARGDPAPNASNNVKWLILGAPSTDVVIASSNTAIPATADGDTYIHTGSSNITYTLPAASGGSAVANGFLLTISNQGAGDLTVDGAGADTIDRQATLVLDTLGRSVQLQKVSNGSWITIADTKDESGGGTPDLRGAFSTAATPVAQDRFFFTDENQTGDPVRYVTFNNLLNALITDDSILDQAKASRAASDRGLFLGVSTTDENALVLRAAGGAATDATARAAAAAAQRTADAKLSRDDLPPFASIFAIPQGIDGNNFPTPFELFFSERITSKTITRLVVTVGGQVATISAITPLSRIAGTAVDSGSLQFALPASAINNIRTNISSTTDSVDFQVTFSFNDGTSYLHTIPFPVNNPVFAPPSPRVQTVTPTATAVVLNYSNGSAVQLNMNRNVTLNLGGGVHGQSMLVQTVQDSTGNRTITLNAAVQREGRAAPVLSTAANARDYLYFYRDAAAWKFIGIIKAG